MILANVVQTLSVVDLKQVARTLTITDATPNTRLFSTVLEATTADDVSRRIAASVTVYWPTIDASSLASFWW